MDTLHPIADRVNLIHGSDSCVPASRASAGGSGEYHASDAPGSRPDEDAVRFGAIVTRLRMERGWTIADLSRLSGLNATWLGVLERGGNIPSLATIFKLAAVFGVEAAALVREIEQSRRGGNAPASQ